MTHLTLTGYHAGAPLCDMEMDKSAALTRGEKFLHAVYCPPSIRDSAECCPACKKIWDEAEPDTED